MSDITFSATMDEKDVQRALQNMVKENAKLRAEIGMGVQESKAAAAQEREWQKLREKATKDATQQMQQLNASAQRIKDSVATPFEEAKKKVAELRDHLQAGRLTVDEYRMAYARVAKEMKEASRDHAAEAEAAKAAAAAKAEATKKAVEAERAHSQAVKDATAVADRYATKEERVAAELKRLNALKEKGVLSSKDHARAVEAENAKLSDSGGIMGGLTSKMAGFVGGLASAGAVIATIKSEYDALIERQGKSADANINLAAEQEALLMNLGGADAGQVAGDIRKLSKENGIKEENVTRTVNEAMAARGDLGVDAVVKAVGSVAKIRKFAPTEMAGLAAATVDTQKQTGLGTDESLGFLLQMQGQSRTKNLKGLAENFTPAVGGIMNLGTDRQTAGALLASLSHGMGDTTGAMSATSGIQLAKQLREYGRGGGPELQAQLADLGKTHETQTAALNAEYDKKGIALNAQEMPSERKAELRRQLAEEEKAKKAALKDSQASEVAKVESAAPAVPIADVLKRMQNDREYRENFLKGKDKGGFGATFEAKALPAIESLLSGGTQAKQFEAAKQALNQDPTKALEDAIKARGSSAAIGLAEKDQALANVTDQQRLADTGGAESAIVRERLAEIRAASGRMAIGVKAQTLIEDVTSGGKQTGDDAIKAIEQEIKMLESGNTIENRGKRAIADTIVPGASLFMASRDRKNAGSEENKETIALLKELLAVTKTQMANSDGKPPAGEAQPGLKGQLQRPDEPTGAKVGKLAPDDAKQLRDKVQQPEPNRPQKLGEISAGGLRPSGRLPAPTAAEQEFFNSVNDIRTSPNRPTAAQRMRVHDAEAKLKLEMPPEYKTAMEHQTAVLIRIEQQNEAKTHAGVVAGRAQQEGRQ